MDMPLPGSGKMHVLERVMRYGPCSRKAIADALGLTRSSITKISSQLIEDGLLTELGEQVSGFVGRREIMLGVVPGAASAVGVEIGSHEATVSLCSLDAMVRKVSTFMYDSLTVEVAEQIAGSTADTAAACEGPMLGIGVLAQGYIENRMCLSLPTADIVSRIERAAGQRCALSNNVRAIALAEQYLASPCDDFVLLKYGPGVGMAVVINGRIITGVSGRAGELGHVRWRGGSQTCCPVCGGIGCLECEVGYNAVASKAGGIPYTRAELSDVLKASRTDGGRALRAALYELSEAAAMAISILAPEELLIAGELFTDKEYFDMFADMLAERGCPITRSRIHPVADYADKRRRAPGIIALCRYIAEGQPAAI